VFISTWLAYAGFYFCRKAFYIVKGALSETFGFTASDLGELGTAYLVAYTLGQFIAAGLGQKTGPRVLLLLGMAVSVVANLVFGIADGYWTFFTFLVVNGLAQATGWPTTIGTLASWTRREERGFLLGLWSTCYQLGGVAASAWAALWLHHQGWRAAFFASSGVLMLAWVVVFLFQRNRPRDVGLAPIVEDDEGKGAGKDGAGGAASTMRSIVATVLLVGTFYFGVKFIRYALWSWTPFLLEKSFGLARDDAGYLSTVFDIAGFAGVVAAGFVSDRFFHGRRGTTAFVMLLGMLVGCGLLVSMGSVSVVWFAVCIGVIGFMLYGPDALLSGAGAIDIGKRKAAVAAAGIINGMGSLGSVLQETVVASAYEANGGEVGAVFTILVVAAGVSVAAIAVVLWRNRRGLSDV